MLIWRFINGFLYCRATRIKLVFILSVLIVFVVRILIFAKKGCDPDYMMWDIYQARSQKIKKVVGSLCEGRLANQMFCFASLQGIASTNNMAAAFEKDSLLHSVFQTRKRARIHGIDTNSLGKYFIYQEKDRRAGTYDGSTKSITWYANSYSSNVFIKGFLQSWRYFVKQEDLVRKLFTFHEHISTSAAKFIENSLLRRKEVTGASKPVVVGIHVRRGDMVEEQPLIDKGYTVPDRDYFQRSMNYYRKKLKNVMFIVCSDDMRWTKENIFGTDVMYSEGNEAGVDMAILAGCDHVIVSVGSFGWWAAWLANGTAVFYNNWPKPLSPLDSMVNKADYFKPEWIAM